jgi:DNA-binding NarL/FixJ family response regulator
MPADQTARGVDRPELAADRVAIGSNVPFIFILSDVRLYREGLARSLAQRPDLGAVGISALNAEALAEIADAMPAAVLLDFAAPGALHFLREINRLIPGIKVIAFAVSEIEDDLIACIEAGIAGFVTRDASVDDLVQSIKNALRDEVICPPRIAGMLFKRVAALSEAGTASPQTLTRREREIAELLNEGLSNKEIARSLQIGSATVKNHVHNILEKLHVRRRGEAAARLRGIMGEHGAHQALSGPGR